MCGVGGLAGPGMCLVLGNRWAVRGMGVTGGCGALLGLSSSFPISLAAVLAAPLHTAPPSAGNAVRATWLQRGIAGRLREGHAGDPTAALEGAPQ